MSHYAKRDPPKRRTFSPNELDQLRTLAAIRVPLHQQAALFKNHKGKPMTPASFQEAIARDPAARHAVEEGRSQAATNVRKTLFSMAMGERKVDPVTLRPTEEYARPPDLKALVFWCESQEGFSRADAKITAKAIASAPQAPQAPVVVFTIPPNNRDRK